MSMKDEILEAVALAVADVWKAHDAEVAGLRDEIAALKLEVGRVGTLTAARADLNRSHINTLRGDLQKALEAIVTEGQVQSIFAPLFERLDAVETTAERFASIEDVKGVRNDIAELAFASVSPGRMAEMLAPLRETLDAHTESLEGLVTIERLEHELEPVLESVAELKTVAEEGLSEERARGMAEDAVAPVRAQTLELHDALQQYALQEDLDHKIDLVATQAKSDYATKDQVADAIRDTWKRLDEGAVETQRQILAVHESVCGVDDAVVACLKEMPPSVTPEQLDAALEPLRLAQGLLDDLVQSRATPEQIQKAQEETVDMLQTALIQRYADADAWARGGPGYQQHALVTHRSGLWQAWRRTHEEPGAGQDWQLLVDGVAGGAFGPSDLEGHSTLALEMTSGRRLEMQVRQPVPVYRGVYTPGETYAPWETVAKDERVFLCLQDTDRPPGEVVGEWQVFTGPPGRKGRNAPPVDEGALAQRVADDVLRQLVPQIQDVVDRIQ